MRTHELDLLLEQAGRDLARPGSLVQAALAFRHPFEVLDHVGDVGVLARDPGRLEGLIQDPSCRPDERLPLEVLVVSGLLTDEHHARRAPALPEHGLGRVAEERTPLAAVCASRSDCIDRRAGRKGSALIAVRSLFSRSTMELSCGMRLVHECPPS